MRAWAPKDKSGWSLLALVLMGGAGTGVVGLSGSSKVDGLNDKVIKMEENLEEIQRRMPSETDVALIRQRLQQLSDDDAKDEAQDERIAAEANKLSKQWHWLNDNRTHITNLRAKHGEQALPPPNLD